jgi:nucleotidyltransferase/DNA polymerase involved in DNA repair
LYRHLDNIASILNSPTRIRDKRKLNHNRLRLHGAFQRHRLYNHSHGRDHKPSNVLPHRSQPRNQQLNNIHNLPRSHRLDPIRKRLLSRKLRSLNISSKHQPSLRCSL